MGKEFDTAKAEMTKQAGEVAVREEGGTLIYTVGKVDIISRNPADPGAYVCLEDFPKFGYRKGETKHLAEPYDEQCACTCRDLAEVVKADAAKAEKAAAADKAATDAATKADAAEASAKAKAASDAEASDKAKAKAAR